MASQREAPWSNDEKNYLLAEMIKSQSPRPDVLYNVVAGLGIQQPRWEDLPLPPGRSLNSCRFAFDELRRTHPPQSLLHTSYGPQTPLSAPPGAGFGGKRPFQPEPFYPAGREIRPKVTPASAVLGQPSTSEPPQKRKRGRPTKASKLQAEASGRAEPGPAPPPAPLAIAAPATPTIPTLPPPPPIAGIPVPAMETRAAPPPQPPTTRMPISDLLTPTAAPKSASQSSSSSGKRRRARSNRSEKDETTDSTQLLQQQDYTSPYDVPQDTPARTAALRHREEPTPTTTMLAPQPPMTSSTGDDDMPYSQQARSQPQ